MYSWIWNLKFHSKYQIYKNFENLKLTIFVESFTTEFESFLKYKAITKGNLNCFLFLSFLFKTSDVLQWENEALYKLLEMDLNSFEVWGFEVIRIHRKLFVFMHRCLWNLKGGNQPIVFEERYGWVNSSQCLFFCY